MLLHGDDDLVFDTRLLVRREVIGAEFAFQGIQEFFDFLAAVRGRDVWFGNLAQGALGEGAEVLDILDQELDELAAGFRDRGDQRGELGARA